MRKKRRIEKLSVKFSNGNADGWIFGVGDCFRTQLDIRLDERIDTAANKEKAERLGRKLKSSEKIKRRVWTQGEPPAYSFDRGHMFHELIESPEGMKRTIVVERARPDPGSLIERETSDDDGLETTVVTEDTSEETSEGFVDFYVLTYKNGAPMNNENGSAIKEQSSRSQAGFVKLLQSGK